MFDIANAFEQGDYNLNLTPEYHTEPYKPAIKYYSLASLTLRSQEIPLVHPYHPFITLKTQNTNHPA